MTLKFLKPLSAKIREMEANGGALKGDSDVLAFNLNNLLEYVKT